MCSFGASLRPVRLGLPVAAGAIGLALAFVAWNQTWDDSAITLGYSHTLAQTGAIQFGRYGERVEGYSTPLWMLLCALIARVAQTPASLLFSAKFCCAVLYVANGWLLYRYVRGLSRSDWLSPIVSGLFLLSTIAVVSVADGMENHLFVTLHLCVASAYMRLRTNNHVPRPAGATVLAGTVVLLFLCRPEAVLSMVALGLAVVRDWPHLARRRRAELLAALGIAAVLCGAFLGWRYSYFGALVPNTVYAKVWPPYVKTGWLRPYTGLTAIAKFVLASMLWAVPLGITPRRLRGLLAGLWAIGREHVFPAGAVALFLLYHFATGSHWGTPNRIFMPVLPFALTVVALAVQRANLRCGARRVLVGALLFLAAQAVFFGLYLQNRITVERVKLLLEPAVRLARLSADKPAHLAAPDMGATLLWWGQELRLTDLGLLNDRQTATRGWCALAPILFAGQPPTVIETHRSWTVLSGLDRSPVFLAQYAQVSVDGRFYQVRRDVLDRLLENPPPGVSVRRVADIPAEEQQRMKSVRFTDFPAGDTAIPLPWEWALEISSAAD